VSVLPMSEPAAARSWSYRTIDWTKFPPLVLLYVVQSKLSRRLTMWQKNLRRNEAKRSTKSNNFLISTMEKPLKP
jgi:hypothetical protein